MDKQFWLALRKDKFPFPAGQNLRALTDEIFSYLGSTDPELRDQIGYEAFAYWLEQKLYSPDEIRGHITHLQSNLKIGLGEQNTDTVFLRAFSILCLAEIIFDNNKYPYLEQAEVLAILDSGLAYIAAENDPRGYTEEKGWAHALAHSADFLMELARNSLLDEPALTRILDAISAKLKEVHDSIYIHGEDDRLAGAVLAIFSRDLLPLEQIKTWLDALIANWKGAWLDESRAGAYFNSRNFLRAIHLRVVSSKDLPRKEELSNILLDAVIALKPY